MLPVRLRLELLLRRLRLERLLGSGRMLVVLMVLRRSRRRESSEAGAGERRRQKTVHG